MKLVTYRSTLLVLFSVLAASCAIQRPISTQTQPQPKTETSPQPRWTFNARRADGYSIDLVHADPEPGTILVAGSTVTFKITATYSMTVTEKGHVTLVFQNKAGLVDGTTPQTSKNVDGSHGTVELSRVVTIPQAERLQLFIPLVPDKFTATDGEIVILYPVAQTP